MKKESRKSRFNFLSQLKITPQVSGLITRLLEGVLSGSDDIQTSPIGKDGRADGILIEWDKIYQSLLISNPVNSTLQDIEDSNRIKYEPRSIAKPWIDRKADVQNYFDPEQTLATLEPQSPGAKRLRPMSLETAVTYLKNDTNSGLPFYMKKGKVKAIVLADFKQLLAQRNPCVMFTRTQEGGKTRTIWGFPIADTLNEMRYYQPLLAVQKKKEWRSAINTPHDTDLAITKLIDYAVNRGYHLVSIDFSAYDASVKGQLQKASFAYVKSYFQSQFDSDIDYIAERFGTIGLITPDGILDGFHGVPSGSTFTNEVDSIAQYLCAMSAKLDLSHFQIQGDDGAYATDNPEKLYESFTSRGLTVNEAKSDIAYDYIIYLQNLYHNDYRGADGTIRGIYSCYRALTRIVYQERFDGFKDFGIEGKDYYAIRTLSILENCKHHPYFKEFVVFIHNADKYGLVPSQQSIDLYVKMQNVKAGAVGLFKHQYGDDITGIRKFESYKIVSKL
jgi:hypothetical protein